MTAPAAFRRSRPRSRPHSGRFHGGFDDALVRVLLLRGRSVSRRGGRHVGARRFRRRLRRGGGLNLGRRGSGGLLGDRLGPGSEAGVAFGLAFALALRALVLVSSTGAQPRPRGPQATPRPSRARPCRATRPARRGWGRGARGGRGGLGRGLKAAAASAAALPSTGRPTVSTASATGPRRRRAARPRRPA